MAGIYFHIPFCKQKCTYCDFYKSIKTDFINDYVKAVKLELLLRCDYLNNEEVKTIYFGGGTPSLLNPEQIESLLFACNEVFKIAPNAEITLEANPDDLDLDYLTRIKQVGVNRLSIGIQSFSDDDLLFMGRRHNSGQAVSAISDAQAAGFNNISVDLIYGIPNMSFEQWQINLQQVFAMNVQHLSAYHLTFHKGTQLWEALQKRKISEIGEEESMRQFNELIEQSGKNGFVQYEISNFAKDELYSEHNSSYWKQTNYLGLGPSAHSYNGQSRQWNISSVKGYLKAIEHNEIPAKIEHLSFKDRFNDYVITSLRTIWGIDLTQVELEFGEQLKSYLLKKANKYIQTGHVAQIDNKIVLQRKGVLISDSIMSDLIM